MTVTINGTEIFLDPAQLPELTYSLFSLTEPDKVSGTKSTTWKVPATRELVSVLGTWDPEMEYPYTEMPTIRIAEGTEVILEGKVIVASRSREEYELVILANNAGWIPTAKETNIQDLSLGTSGEVDAAYQIASWSDEDQTDHYPLFDYGAFAGRASSYDVSVGQVRPAVRIHRMLSRFFEDAGYTIAAKGSFADIWKKLVMPGATGHIQISNDILEDASAKLSNSTAQTPTLSFAAYTFPELDTIVSDPGGNVTGTSPNYTYTAPYGQTMEVTVRLKGTFNYSGPNGVVVAAERAGVQLLCPVRVFNASNTGSGWVVGIDETWTFPASACNVSEIIRIGLLNNSSAANFVSSSIEEFEVTYTVTNVNYQEGVTFDIASTLPEMKVSEVVKGLCNIFNLVAYTSDTEKSVELWPMDEWLRPISEGIDWTGRLDHSDPVRFVQQDVPRRVEFRYKEDDKDYPLKEYEEENGVPYGAAYRNVPGGWSAVYEVEAPWAATIMRETFDGLIVPTAWSLYVGYQVANYKIEPRILIADGTAGGSWTFDGVSRTEYPNCYFVEPSGTFGRSLSFQTYGSVLGTADNQWKRRLERMADGRAIEGAALVYPHELADLDIGRPVYVDHGGGAGWYYRVELSGVRPFDGDGLASVQLMPV